jgi:hypothetical protein
VLKAVERKNFVRWRRLYSRPRNSALTLRPGGYFPYSCPTNQAGLPIYGNSGRLLPRLPKRPSEISHDLGISGIDNTQVQTVASGKDSQAGRGLFSPAWGLLLGGLFGRSLFYDFLYDFLYDSLYDFLHCFPWRDFLCGAGLL